MRPTEAFQKRREAVSTNKDVSPVQSKLRLFSKSKNKVSKRYNAVYEKLISLTSLQSFKSEAGNYISFLSHKPIPLKNVSVKEGINI